MEVEKDKEGYEDLWRRIVEVEPKDEEIFVAIKELLKVLVWGIKKQLNVDRRVKKRLTLLEKHLDSLPRHKAGMLLGSSPFGRKDSPSIVGACDDEDVVQHGATKKATVNICGKFGRGEPMEKKTRW